jgi:uncharacterized protein (TIGR02266 family)
MGAERRADPRADVNLEVRYRSTHDFMLAYAKNISGGGICIRTAKPLPLNSEVQLRFSLPGFPTPFEVKGLVVWTNPFGGQTAFPTGMGIKFLEMSPDDKKVIDDFVRAELAKSRPTPASVEAAGPEA